MEKKIKKMKKKKEKENKKKKESYIAPLKLESLLKSFFAEEIRDLSCEKCNFPSSKAKVRKKVKCSEVNKI